MAASELRKLSPLLFLLALAGCGSSGGGGSDDSTVQPEMTRDVQVTPSSGPPASLVRVAGLDETASGEITVTVGDERAPARTNKDGTLTVALPLFLDESGWPAPPAATQTLRVYRDGILLAEARDAVTVTALPEAPGTTAKIAGDLSYMTTSLQEILSQFIPPSAELAQHHHAAMETMKALVDNGDQSLSALLARPDIDARDLALLDAILASSGAAKKAEAMAQLLLELRAAAAGPAFAARAAGSSYGGLCNGTGADVELACKMQLYVVLKLFAETVVHDTADTYSKTVGLAVGLIGVSGAGNAGLTFAQVVGALLTVTDFVMNKIVVAALPAKIDALELSLADNRLARGAMTDAVVTVTASNDPPPISLQDVLGAIIDLLGAGDVKLVRGFEAELNKSIEFVLTTYRTFFADYASQFPELNLDPELSRYPKQTWGPIEITDPRLVQRFSFTTGLVTGVQDQVEWQALEQAPYGEARIQARTGGNEGTVLQIPWFVTYAAGAFGENAAASDTKSIYITPDLVLEVDFASSISLGGANVLGARAGYREADGSVTYQENVLIQLAVVNGSVDASQGLTDASGQFNTLARIGDCASALTVTVTATGDFDAQETVTVEAQCGGEGVILTNVRADANNFYPVSDPRRCQGTSNASDTTVWVREPTPPPVTVRAECQESYITHTTALASGDLLTWTADALVARDGRPHVSGRVEGTWYLPGPGTLELTLDPGWVHGIPGLGGQIYVTAFAFFPEDGGGAALLNLYAFTTSSGVDARTTETRGNYYYALPVTEARAVTLILDVQVKAGDYCPQNEDCYGRGSGGLIRARFIRGGA